jgi:hypothetical protein
MDNVSSIVVRWDPPEPLPDNLQYKVYFAAIDETGYQPQGEVVFRICDSSQTSASITDLAPRSRYQVRIGTVAGLVSESSSTPELIVTPDISKIFFRFKIIFTKKLIADIIFRIIYRIRNIWFPRIVYSYTKELWT